MSQPVIVQVGNQGAIHATEAAYRDGYEHAGAVVIGIDQAEAYALGPRYFLMKLDELGVPEPALVVYSRTHNNTALTPAWTDVWRTLEERGTKTASVHLDVFWGLPEREQWIREGDPLFTTGLVLTADGGSDEKWEAAGVNHRWLPPGTDTRFVPPQAEPYEELAGKIVFVGSSMGYHDLWPHRMQMVAFARTHWGPRFVEFGNGTERGPVRGAELARVYASDCIVIGDFCFAGRWGWQWSDRIPETLGRGGLLCVTHTPGLDFMYESGWDLLTWQAGDFEGLAEQIECIDQNPDQFQNIGAQGRKTVWARDTYRHRAKEILDIMEIGQ